MARFIDQLAAGDNDAWFIATLVLFAGYVLIPLVVL